MQVSSDCDEITEHDFDVFVFSWLMLLLLLLSWFITSNCISQWQISTNRNTITKYQHYNKTQKNITEQQNNKLPKHKITINELKEKTKQNDWLTLLNVIY